MRFHVLSLPHTSVTKDFPSCAYTQKVYKFCKMMKSLGHYVVLYSPEKVDSTICDLHVNCLSEEERIASLNGEHYTKGSFNYTLPHWRKFNENAIRYMRSLLEPQDFICTIAGIAHKEVADAFPGHITVEFGVGYQGTFSPYRVFESYSWMHMIYAQQQGPQSAQGIWFDEVIPNSYEVEDFPRGDPQDYFLYLGRITPDKGVNLASEVCKKMNKKLIVAGPLFGQNPPEYGEYVGEVDSERRAHLLSNATAVFTPSLYLEPFCGVAVEAQMCGTPVISTDWGAFVETVEDHKTGYRCRSFKEFCSAVRTIHSLDRSYTRGRAQKLYSTGRVKHIYEKYFYRLMTLWRNGFYE